MSEAEAKDGGPYTYRFRQAIVDGKPNPWVQLGKKRWYFPWSRKWIDLFPVSNYVNSKRREFINTYRKLLTLREEIKESEGDVDHALAMIAAYNQREGYSAIWNDRLVSSEPEIPNQDKEYKEISKFVLDPGSKKHRGYPHGGRETQYALPEHFNLVNREAEGDDYVDQVMRYRSPNKQQNQNSGRRKGKGGGGNNNQNNQNRNDNDD